MLKPKCLRPGDAIGVVAPSSPVEPEEFEQGARYLTERGYTVIVGESVLARHPENDYLAGTDAQRAADLNAFLARPDLAAIFCARGGYGASRLFPHLDWSTFAQNPKILLGYSDITSLHLMAAHHAPLVTFHAPMPTRLPKLDATASALFWSLLENPSPIGRLPATPDTMTTLVPGDAEGELAGGCITLLAAACGTPYAPDFRGKIVLLEDVGEALYRIDRYLIQLRNAGLFDQAAGFVLGTVTGWNKQEADPPQATLDALWRDIFLPLGKPTITNFPFGHEPNPLSLPLGVRARLDADARTLTLLESATR